VITTEANKKLLDENHKAYALEQPTITKANINSGRTFMHCGTGFNIRIIIGKKIDANHYIVTVEDEYADWDEYTIKGYDQKAMHPSGTTKMLKMNIITVREALSLINCKKALSEIDI